VLSYLTCVSILYVFVDVAVLCIIYVCWYRKANSPQLTSLQKHSLEATGSPEMPLSMICDTCDTPTVIQIHSDAAAVVQHGQDELSVEQCAGYLLYNNNFRHFDPRLSLNIDLNVFKEDNEQLVLLLKVGIYSNV